MQPLFILILGSIIAVILFILKLPLTKIIPFLVTNNLYIINLREHQGGYNDGDNNSSHRVQLSFCNGNDCQVNKIQLFKKKSSYV